MKKTILKIVSAIMSVIILFSITTIVYAEEPTAYKYGDIIQFGSYPQTEVTDENLISELNSLAPVWDEWISYGYSDGSGEGFGYGTMIPGDWMRYTDITLEGSMYRGVKFTQYRPHYTTSSSNSRNTYQQINGYNLNTIYWFKYEPIKWLVIDPDNGVIVCDLLIDAQPFSNTIYENEDENISDDRLRFFNDASYNNFANDYETSSIRYWLNNYFYDVCFTTEEKEQIGDSTLSNEGYDTSFIGKEPFNGNTTVDKVFLLSEVEIEKYFRNVGNYSGLLTSATDYTKSQGICVDSSTVETFWGSLFGTSDWILRTAATVSDKCCYIYLGGLYPGDMVYTVHGIRPALKLKIMTQDDIEEPTPEDPSINPDEPDIPDNSSCPCNCHKDGFMGFIWKIILFFNKLFKTNRECACGIAHY